MVRAPELVVVMGVAVLVLCCGVVCFDGDQDLSRAYAAAWLDARPSVLATLRSINASHIASAVCFSFSFFFLLFFLFSFFFFLFFLFFLFLFNLLIELIVLHRIVSLDRCFLV